MTEIIVTTKHKLTYQVYACWSEEGGMGEQEYGTSTTDLAFALQMLNEARAKDMVVPAARRINWFLKTTVETTSVPRA